jgi:hypothetical protein
MSTTHEVQLTVVVTTPDDISWSAVQDEIIDAVVDTHCGWFFIEGIIGHSKEDAPVDDRDPSTSAKAILAGAMESNRRRH